jgi:hypothetical protein
MPRKPIPDDIQKNILMKSRRRCCLCFWLEGVDEVQKGQICHLDNNNENAAEDNLVFLCFNHHDDLDGTTRISKGLKPNEVREWRDELYKEMQYKFRSGKHKECRLSVEHFVLLARGTFKASFRVTNTGEGAVRTPTVAIRLPDNIAGELPPKVDRIDTVIGMYAEMPRIDLFAAREATLDIFEPNGRVTIHELRGINPVLMAGHAYSFEALVFKLTDYPLGTPLELEYRIDGEDMPPVFGRVVATVPVDTTGFARDD